MTPGDPVNRGHLPSLAAIDLAWGSSRPSTAALDGAQPHVIYNVFWDDLTSVADRLATRSMLLVDAPLTPAANSFRPVDLALMRCGIPCLPPGGARTQGIRAAQLLKRHRPDLEIFEAYPYQIYKVFAWLFQQGHAGVPLQGHALHSGFSSFRPPSYKRARGPSRDMALRYAENLLRLFCSMDTRPALASVPPSFRADALDALFMIGLAKLAREGSFWVLALGNTDPKWLVLGDQWLMDCLSRHCDCQLYSDTTREV